MSVKAITWAFDQQTGDALAKLILISIADFADPSGVAYPSRKTLAERAEVSLDTVDRKMATLIELKLMEKVTRNHRHGDATSNEYRLCMGGWPLPAATPAANSGYPQPPIAATPPANSGYRYEPSSNRQAEPSPEPPPDKPAKQASERGLKFADWFRSTLPADIRLSKGWREKWAICFDDMLRLDGRDPEQVWKICQWARADEFWQKNFLSPSKLRERDQGGIQYFDRFAERAKEPNKGAKAKAEKSAGEYALKPGQGPRTFDPIAAAKARSQK